MTGLLEEDWQLLKEYALRGSEWAFGEVVSRHIDMVHSAALRQVRDKHLAEDVAQAVFMILARKAASLPPGTIVSAWLLTTTRYACANALRMRMRRDRHERKAGETMRHRWQHMLARRGAGEEHSQWDDVAPLLDDAVAKLGRVDREAVVLRFFEQKSLRDVGEALGLSEDAAKKRVSRALFKLRGLMMRTGKVSLPAIALGTLLQSNAVQAAPNELAPKVIAASLSGAEAAMVPPVPMDIARSTGMLMTWFKVRWAAAAMLLGLVGLGPVAVNLAINRERPQPATVQREAMPPVEAR